VAVALSGIAVGVAYPIVDTVLEARDARRSLALTHEVGQRMMEWASRHGSRLPTSVTNSDFLATLRPVVSNFLVKSRIAMAGGTSELPIMFKVSVPHHGDIVQYLDGRTDWED